MFLSVLAVSVKSYGAYTLSPFLEWRKVQAIQKDASFAKNLKELVILGGAFFSSGNVNPAAEANVSSFEVRVTHFASE